MPTVLTPNNSPFSSLVQSKSKKDLAYDFLKNKIVLNEFPEGTVLVERQLCELMDASRTPIREAIQQLLNEGLVVNLPGKGAVVSALRYEDIVQLYDVREYLERHAVRQGALEISEPTNRYMELIVQQLDQYLRLPDYTAYYSTDLAFHKTIVFSTKNDYLIRTYMSLVAQIERITHYIIGIEVAQLLEVNMTHHEMLANIKAGDAAAAESATSRHIQACKSNYLRLFSPSTFMSSQQG